MDILDKLAAARKTKDTRKSDAIIITVVGAVWWWTGYMPPFLQVGYSAWCLWGVIVAFSWFDDWQKRKRGFDPWD